MGGSGSCLQSRSGERVPLGPKTLRSLKHSVSTIWGGRVGLSRVAELELSPPFDGDPPQHLVLPGDGDAAGGKLGVEIVVGLVQVDAFHGGELLDVQHVLAIHGPGLGGPKRHQLGGLVSHPPAPWHPHGPEPYVWHEGGLRDAGLQALEVDGPEEGMALHLGGPVRPAAQPLLGVLGQELGRGTGSQG